MDGSATLLAAHVAGRGTGEPGTWTINVLGPLEVWCAGRAVTLPPRRRSLLALLALRAGAVVTAEHLVDGLWGEYAPPTAVRTLHAHIAKLSAALSEFGDARVIQRRDPGYTLIADAVRVDRDRFEDRARAGLRDLADGRYADAAHRLGGALALWRGPALAGCPVSGWAVAEADYLEELRLQAHESALAARLAAGTQEPTVGEIERLVAEHPLRERLWALLIVALQVSGRAGDALGAYQRARRTLIDELGIEPGEALRHVEAAVLRGAADPRTLLRLTPPSAATRSALAGGHAAATAKAARPDSGHVTDAPGGALGFLGLPEEISSLIGRDSDVAEIAAVLNATRLVTLTGFGGCGKTRLAVAVARVAAADFTDVAFADLATVHNRDAAPTARTDAAPTTPTPAAPTARTDAAPTARTDAAPTTTTPAAPTARTDAAPTTPMGAPPTTPTDAVALATLTQVRPGTRTLDELARWIADDRVLIVLDNCEHVIAECARMARELLTRCPRLKILATSQEALRLPGEVVHTVTGLGSPHPALVRSAADLAGYGAVALFAERAGIAAIETLSPADARAVAVICARCDGLPLAVELAAAKSRLLTLPAIAARLEDPYAVLTDGPRGSRPQHEALRATVEWSFEMLTTEEQDALKRFSVLGGTFTLETATAVHHGPSAIRTISRLVDRSLLKAIATPSGMRYQLLETIRGYALELLAASPEEYAQARREHAAYYLHCAEEVERRLQGPALGALMTEVEEHHDDLHAALTWLVGDDPESALRLAAALWRYHYLSGRYHEGREWLGTALAAASQSDPGSVSDSDLAKAQWSAARLAALECDYQEADRLARNAMDLYAKRGDDLGVAQTQSLLGAVCRELGDYEQAIDLSLRSLELAERRGDTWAAGHTLQLLSFASWLSGDFAAAARHSGRAVRMLNPVGDRERLAWCRLDMGATAFYTGHVDAASLHLAQALLVFLEVRFKEGIAWAENLLALVDLAQGRQQGALRRLATSLRLHHELGDRWRQASVLDTLAGAVARQGDGVFAAELLGAAEHIRGLIGTPVPSCERLSHDETVAVVCGMLSAAIYEDVRSHSRDLNPEGIQRRITALLPSPR
ncbi:tetratricopeptide repeat protein [Streptosporangiaceae bacterium NEAU-GS5]|nr:tetratricopeptide repeat protein [Streptosporangiaceae bacterium NEAU-GS5]